MKYLKWKVRGLFYLTDIDCGSKHIQRADLHLNKYWSKWKDATQTHNDSRFHEPAKHRKKTFSNVSFYIRNCRKPRLWIMVESGYHFFSGMGLGTALTLQGKLGWPDRFLPRIVPTRFSGKMTKKQMQQTATWPIKKSIVANNESKVSFQQDLNKMWK